MVWEKRKFLLRQAFLSLSYESKFGSKIDSVCVLFMPSLGTGELEWIESWELRGEGLSIFFGEFLCFASSSLKFLSYSYSLRKFLGYAVN